MQPDGRILNKRGRKPKAYHQAVAKLQIENGILPSSSHGLKLKNDNPDQKSAVPESVKQQRGSQTTQSTDGRVSGPPSKIMKTKEELETNRVQTIE